MLFCDQRVNFSEPVSSVSILLGDFDADADPLHLEAYSSLFAGGTLQGTDIGFLPAPVIGGLVLTVTAPGVNSIRMFGERDNSVYADDIAVDTGVVIPEPSMLLLIGGGVVSFCLPRARRKKM